MKVQTNNLSGEVVFYPAHEPRPKAGHTIREVTPAIQAVIDQGGPFKWVPDDEEEPKGPGTLTKVDPPAAPVPAEIANWRARVVLAQAGLLDDVETALNTLPEPEKSVALAAWNGGAPLARKGAFVAHAAAPSNLNLSEAQLDEMFRQAAAIPA